MNKLTLTTRRVIYSRKDTARLKSNTKCERENQRTSKKRWEWQKMTDLNNKRDHQEFKPTKRVNQLLCMLTTKATSKREWWLLRRCHLTTQISTTSLATEKKIKRIQLWIDQEMFPRLIGASFSPKVWIPPRPPHRETQDYIQERELLTMERIHQTLAMFLSLRTLEKWR